MTVQPESHHSDHKSLRKVMGTAADFAEVARDCVCFANGAGGTILIGIEVALLACYLWLALQSAREHPQ